MQNIKRLEENLNKLPQTAYAIHPTSNALIITSRGEMGYWTVCEAGGLTRADIQQLADSKNAALGVSKRQAEAMLAGSLFGFHADVANPDHAIYDKLEV